jgi:dienelactone hydrolase
MQYLRQLTYVHPKSIVVYGCSNGGDLALEVASANEVCALIAEEPATIMLSGVFNTSTPKKGDRYTPADSFPICEDPKRYYLRNNREITRSKIATIACPILIVQGDRHPINKFNAEIFIPELRAMHKKPAVKTYPGEPHCFCFSGSPPQAPRPAVAIAAFREMEAFCRRYVVRKPAPIDSSLLRETSVN